MSDVLGTTTRGFFLKAPDGSAVNIGASTVAVMWRGLADAADANQISASVQNAAAGYVVVTFDPTTLGLRTGVEYALRFLVTPDPLGGSGRYPGGAPLTMLVRARV